MNYLKFQGITCETSFEFVGEAKVYKLSKVCAARIITKTEFFQRPVTSNALKSVNKHRQIRW